jgi:phosphopantothenoylcysteine decarboxylase/phosphopantothenate--cysteine ligase
MLATLTHKRVILGVSGGIAAYKSADLVRRLRDAGAEVQVVMTAAAQQFITPLTMQALSGNPVHTELLNADAEAGMGHIELARWADLVLIAPASADVMARLAHGVANDLLTTLVVSNTRSTSRCSRDEPANVGGASHARQCRQITSASGHRFSTRVG